MRSVKPLSDAEIKRAKPKAKDYRLSDGGGLYLLVRHNGSKLWRLDYYRPSDKSRTTAGIGSYPEITLVQARQYREEARANLAKEIDPKEKILVGHSFEEVALEWLAMQTDKSDATRAKSLYLLKFAFDDLGKMMVGDVKAKHVLAVCRKAEAAGHLEKAAKVRAKIGQVMRYAVATGRAEHDPTPDLRGALKTPVTKHHAAITEPRVLAELLRDIWQYDGHMITQAALKLAPMVFVRPIELRAAKWADIDLQSMQWAYTPPKTQSTMATEHIVPLSRQVVEIFKDLHDLTGHSEFVFPSLYTYKRCMSENTVNLALRRMGWDGDQMCGHGFRATARTILEEVLDYPVEIIEQQLAHRVRDMHGRAYNRTKHLEKRRIMMQHWSDYLDSLRLNQTSATALVVHSD